MLFHDLPFVSTVAASLSIEVSHYDGNASSSAVLNDSRQSAVELFCYIHCHLLGPNTGWYPCWSSVSWSGRWPIESFGPCASHPVSALCVVLNITQTGLITTILNAKSSCWEVCCTQGLKTFHNSIGKVQKRLLSTKDEWWRKKPEEIQGYADFEKCQALQLQLERSV